MGTKIYTGFSEEQEKQIRAAVADASVAISKAYASCIKESDAEQFSTWFGTGAGDRDSVKTVLQLINYAMENGTININFKMDGNCAGGMVNAVAYVPAFGWTKANVAQARDVASDFTLDICPRLLRVLAFSGPDSQSQVGTLLHEFSHLLGNTNDETDPDTGDPAYGAAAAKQLAQNHPDLAINNAENYGFYISSYLTR